MFADRKILWRIPQCDILHCHKKLLMVTKGDNLKALRCLHILQQLFFIGSCLFHPVFRWFGTFHHLCGLMSDIAAVGSQPSRSRASFRLFHRVGPALRLSGRLFQPADFLLQLFVLHGFKLISSLFIIPPACKISLYHLYRILIQG